MRKSRKNYKRLVGAGVIFSALFIFVTCAPAATLKLKNGREISGKVKEVSDQEVFLDISSGTVWFPREEVESIDGYSVDSWKGSLPTLEAFKGQDKSQVIFSSAQEGLGFVSKARKLEFKGVPWVETCTKEELRANLNKAIEKYNSQEKLETTAKILVKLGLLDDAQDYKRQVLGLLTEETAAYYSPEDKKIYVTEDILYHILPGIPSIVIMHEQMHALQDQYHNLKKIEDALLSENSDKALAVHSVIEGEATVLMYDAFFSSMRGAGLMGKQDKQVDLRSFVIDSLLAYSKRFKTKDNQPAIFMEGLLFPYVWGGSFIQYAVNTKGWEAVDGIYQNLPVSSEQIMHPEKYYILPDEPKKVELPDLSGVLGPSWVKRAQDVLGEFNFYLIGKKFLDELSAKVMSEGWGGDTFALYEDTTTKQTLGISLSKWDSQRDADEFFSLYKKVIEKKYQQAALVKEDKDYTHWKTEKGDVYISESGDTVLVIDGAPEELIPGLTSALAK